MSIQINFDARPSLKLTLMGAALATLLSPLGFAQSSPATGTLETALLHINSDISDARTPSVNLSLLQSDTGRKSASQAPAMSYREVSVDLPRCRVSYVQVTEAGASNSLIDLRSLKKVSVVPMAELLNHPGGQTGTFNTQITEVTPAVWIVEVLSDAGPAFVALSAEEPAKHLAQEMHLAAALCAAGPAQSR